MAKAKPLNVDRDKLSRFQEFSGDYIELCGMIIEEQIISDLVHSGAMSFNEGMILEMVGRWKALKRDELSLDEYNYLNENSSLETVSVPVLYFSAIMHGFENFVEGRGQKTLEDSFWLDARKTGGDPGISRMSRVVRDIGLCSRFNDVKLALDETGETKSDAEVIKDVLDEIDPDGTGLDEQGTAISEDIIHKAVQKFRDKFLEKYKELSSGET